MTSPKIGRAARVGIVALLLVTSLFAGSVRSAPPARAADVGMSKPVYGANEAVIVAVGQTDYVRNCPTGSSGHPPVNDWLYGVSDLYVVPSTWTHTHGATLSDISGEPNVVFGQIGGAFIDEVIGYTAPGGSIPPGRYGIIIDNCQDYTFDPAIDTFIPDAFRVTSDVLVPPLNIGALKADATRRAGSWNDAQLTYTALIAAASAWEWYGVMTDPADALIFFITDFAVKQAGLPDAKIEAMNLLISTKRHWKGIAADPPNYAYDVPVSPGTVPTLESQDTNPMLRSMVALGEQSGVEGSLAEAFLESVEKYQGAARDRNGVWARQHARAAQRYARLLAAQLPVSAAAATQAATDLRADTSDVDTIMSTIGGMLVDARTNGISAEVRRKAAELGISNADLQSGLRAIDNLGMSGISKADTIAALDALVADASATVTSLVGIADDLDAVIAQLDADPLMTSDFVSAHAGGPYAGTTGSTVALNASASTGMGTLGYAWDLDGDGVFDDATGATPSFTVAADTPPLVSVKVTGIDGIADIAAARFTNTTASPGPRITARTPVDGVRDITGGDSLTLSVTPTGGTTTWWVNAVEEHTGNSFTLATAPGDFGSRQVTALVTDANGQMTATTWWVRVKGIDADGDGWPIPLDCRDDDASINPGMPDIANGVDDDCDPSTSDGTPAPTVTITSTDTSVEGAEYLLTGAISGGGGGAISRKVDWGDGTAWTGAASPAAIPHVYADNGTYVVELCGKRPTSPWGCALEEITVTNVAPSVNFVDLNTWTAVDHVAQPSQGRSEWRVADSRDSVLQVRNSDPSVFLSPDSYVDVEATVQLAVETSGDDDFIGFVIGASPDMFTSADADYLVLDWKQWDQLGAARGTRLMRVEGVVHRDALWKGSNAAYTSPALPGTVTELARGMNFGATGWASNRVYDLKFRYTPERFQVWIDGELEFDLTGDFPTDARFGFYNHSQDHVRYRNFAQSGISIDEGDLVDFPGYYADQGVLDSHTGLFSWGDGSPADRVELSSVAGVGAATANHRYLDDGTFVSELCVTDNAGDTGCKERTVYVRNVAPTVAAGRDRTVGPNLILDDSRFTDPGIADTHTATVDWGDGSPVEPAVVSGGGGSGVVAGAHTYSTDGLFTVTVCATDSDGGVGCDSFDVAVLAMNRALITTGEGDITVDEGDLVSRQVAFEDENPTDAHTATIDWGDGSTEAMAVADGGAIGVATATHRYRDDGAYNVAAEVCDDRDACSTARSVVTVRNVVPTITASDGGTITAGNGFSFNGGYGDVGIADTHTGSVTWGDGTGNAFTPQPTVPGAGTYLVTHVFAVAGTYPVQLCVIDDDGGRGCVTRTVTVEPAPVIPPVDPPPPVAPTTTTTLLPPGPATTIAGPGTPAPASPPPPAGRSGLPLTGSTARRTVPLGLAAIAAGVGLVLLARRRDRVLPRRAR